MITRNHVVSTFLSLAALTTLTSCQTHEQAIFPPALPKVEAHVISGTTTRNRRTIASTTDESLLAAEYQEMINAEDPVAAARVYINRVNRIFYHTQSLLNDFDARIDEIAKMGDTAPANALMLDERYVRLMAAWTLKEETTAKVTYFYNQSLLALTSANAEAAMGKELQDRAKLINKGLREGVLTAANSTNRLAKQDLVNDLIIVNDDFHAFQAAHSERRANDGLAEVVADVDSFNAKLKSQVFTSGEDLETFYMRNASQLKRETENARGDQQLKSELDRLAPEMQRHMAEQFDGRAPASVNGATKPGLGRQGMLNGNEFAKGVWALTFDDGPHSIYTLQDLANLQSSETKATFFWLAQHIVRLKSIVGQVKEAGMTLGNHSFSHPQLPKLGATQLAHEIDESTAIDEQVYGFKPKFFRCPYGACGSQTSNVRQKIADQNLISVVWNVDTLDWQDKNPASVYERTKKQMAIQKRGIILFHDIHPQSVTASKMVMADFKAGRPKGTANGGYRTVTMEEALTELNSAEGMK